MLKEVRSSYLEVQREVELTCQWLESLTIGIEQNRVAEYRKIFALIADHHQNGTISDLGNSIDFAKQADSFHDASELVLIHQQLIGYDSPAFIRTLAQAVNGPTSLAAERPQSSDARNKVFELVMAAVLRAAGIQVQFVGPADAVVTVDNIKCFVECKRLQSE
jgi:hypothetical protein